MIKYILFKLIFPTLTLVIAPIIAYLLINYFGWLANNELQWFVLTVDFKNINNVCYVFIIYIFIFYNLLIKIRSHNKDEEFLKGDIYGPKSWLFYLWGNFLGYKRIKPEKKPYKIMYKLLKTELYLIIISDYQESKAEIFISIENPSTNDDEINIFVVDTYDIKMEQLPQEKQKLKTYVIDKVDQSRYVRTFSQNLVNKSSQLILEKLNENKKINLFLTTSAKNAIQIFGNSLLIADRIDIQVNIAQLKIKKNRKRYIL